MSATLEISQIEPESFVMTKQRCKLDSRVYPICTFFYFDGFYLYPICIYEKGYLKNLSYKEELFITEEKLNHYFLLVKNYFKIIYTQPIFKKKSYKFLKELNLLEKEINFSFFFIQKTVPLKLFTTDNLSINVYQMQIFVQFCKIYFPLWYMQKRGTHLFQNVYLENLIPLLISFQALQVIPISYFLKLNELTKVFGNISASIEKLETGNQNKKYILQSFENTNIPELDKFYQELEARNSLALYLEKNSY